MSKLRKIRLHLEKRFQAVSLKDRTALIKKIPSYQCKQQGVVRIRIKVSQRVRLFSMKLTPIYPQQTVSATFSSKLRKSMAL